MFKNTIFDNTKVVEQIEAFQYIDVLQPLNLYTKQTIALYVTINKVLNGESGVWDTDSK